MASRSGKNRLERKPHFRRRKVMRQRQQILSPPRLNTSGWAALNALGLPAGRKRNRNRAVRLALSLWLMLIASFGWLGWPGASWLPSERAAAAHAPASTRGGRAHWVKGAPALAPVAARAIPAAAQANNPVPVVSVSAINFEASAIAPKSFVSGFGTMLATVTLAAPLVAPLPTELGGTKVEVNGRRAGLSFVSPNQVNYVMPDETEVGTAMVVICASDGTISEGTVQVRAVAPVIAAANPVNIANNFGGEGVAAGVLQRVQVNGTSSFESTFQFNPATNSNVTRPINLGPEGERVFVSLFFSGLGNVQNTDGNAANGVAEHFRLLVGGVTHLPTFVGEIGPGQAQLNAELSRALIGAGLVNVVITGQGFGSNLVELEFAGPPGFMPPAITGFAQPQVLAGGPLTINGSGFANLAANNEVLVSGRRAQVVAAFFNQLQVLLPFGIQAGQVTVKTPQGEAVSAASLNVRTSISGMVANTGNEPLQGMTARLIGLGTTAISGTDGNFVLPDTPTGPVLVEIDGTTVPQSPAFPSVVLKKITIPARDNRFSQTIWLQQTNGPQIGVGGAGEGSSMQGGSLTAAARHEDATATTGYLGLVVKAVAALPAYAAQMWTAAGATLNPVSSSWRFPHLPAGAVDLAVKAAADLPAYAARSWNALGGRWRPIAVFQELPRREMISTDGVTFDIQVPNQASFDDGRTMGELTLSIVAGDRTPVGLPPGVFPCAPLAQLAPFRTRLFPGGRLTFPNPKGLAPGTEVTLFTLDQDLNRQNPELSSQTIGSFVPIGKATVSADGMRIETAPDAINITSIFFAGQEVPTATISGQVLDCSGAPLGGATVEARGQSATTDNNGGFVLRFVPLTPSSAGEFITVAASLGTLTGEGKVFVTPNSAAALGGPILLFTPGCRPVAYSQRLGTCNTSSLLLLLRADVTGGPKLPFFAFGPPAGIPGLPVKPPLKFVIVHPPKQGTLTTWWHTPQAFGPYVIYKPSGHFIGTDHFVFKVVNQFGVESNLAIITIVVEDCVRFP
jgi:uncharacterized protein (TIGR03437 family)